MLKRFSLNGYLWLITLMSLKCSLSYGQGNHLYYDDDLKIIEDIHTGNFERAKRTIDSFLTLPNLSHFHQTLFTSRYGLYQTIRGNHDSALNILLNLYNHYEDSSDLELLGDICSYIGRAYLHKNDNINTLKFFYESIHVHQKNQFKNYLGASNCFLGYYLLRSNLLTLAKETMSQGLSFAIKDSNRTEYKALMALNHLILVKEQILVNNIDSAEKAYQQLTLFIVRNKDFEDLSTCLNYGGSIAFLKNNFDIALDNFQKAYESAISLSQEEESIIAVIGKAKCFRCLGKYNQALKELNRIHRNKYYPLYLSTQIYQAYHETYQLLGDDRNARSYAEKYYQANDSLQKNNVSIIILQTEEIKNRYQNDKLIQENLSVNQQLQKQRIIKVSLLVILILMVLLFLISVKAYRSRKRHLSKLFQYSQELQSLNTEIKFKNNILAKTNKSLVDANESLQNFAYTAAHDLKGPLTGIFTYLQLIKHKSDNYEKLPEYIGIFTDKAFNEASRLNSLIQDLLSLSNMDKNLPHPGRVSLVEAVHHFMEVHQNVIAQSQAKIIYDPNLPPLLAHRNMIESLLQNLILNAIKYKHPERNPIISISFKSRTKFIHIYVSDNGLGIEKRYFKEIFQPFKRIATEVEGTGLGLNTCKKIIDYYHGKMVVRSTIHEGSTFCIILPGEMVIEN